jgi:hypothetical protein
MLRVYAHQLEHFANVGRRRFLSVVLEEICTRMPGAVADLTDDALVSVADRLVAIAEQFGVDTQPEALAFVRLALALRAAGAIAPDALSIAPWIERALSEHLAPLGKVRALAARAVALVEDDPERAYLVLETIAGDPIFEALPTEEPS